jgi:hypothetical protein
LFENTEIIKTNKNKYNYMIILEWCPPEKEDERKDPEIRGSRKLQLE